MKIERISDNQIRCTLNKNDLLDRELRISELAYGTEKAKALFRDMMQQASYELGFEAEDIPLMIEAIPVSPECLVLIITKVEDPDELDTRFSKFSSDNNIDEFDIVDDEDAFDDEFISTISEEGDVYRPDVFGDTIDTEQSFVPLSDAVAPHNVYKKDDDNDVKRTVPVVRIFSFHNLDEVIDLAKELNNRYHGMNSLYKDEEQGIYHLIMSNNEHTLDEFHKICNFTSEFGRPERSMYATLSYFEEHFTCIKQGNAIQVLADL